MDCWKRKTIRDSVQLRFATGKKNEISEQQARTNTRYSYCTSSVVLIEYVRRTSYYDEKLRTPPVFSTAKGRYSLSEDEYYEEEERWQSCESGCVGGVQECKSARVQEVGFLEGKGGVDIKD